MVKFAAGPFRCPSGANHRHRRLSTLALAETRLKHFLALTKPRVVSLIVFCAVIGMFLATPGLPPPRIVFFATVGIALVAGAAAAFNCLVEQKIDALMARTRRRPLPSGELTSLPTLAFAGVVGGLGLVLLYHYVNELTMWLTLATFVGYAVVYTVLLKPATPQNIVIGGASGAMPPVLGWSAVTGDVGPEPLILFLIIFVWTPPHFWSLALYRVRGLCERRAADAAGDSRAAIHAAADRALHLRARRGDPAAVRDPHERRRSTSPPRWRWAASFSCTRCSSTATTAILSRGRRSSIRSGIWRRCSRRSSSTTTGDERRHGESRALLIVALALALAGLRPRGTAIPDLGRYRRGVRPRLLAHRPQRQGAHAGRFPRQGRRALLRLHAVPGRLSDHARDAGGGDAAPRAGRGEGPGAVRDDRSRARHARSSCRIT